MSVNTKYTDKPNDQYQRANLKGLVGYFHKRWWQLSYAKNYETKMFYYNINMRNEKYDKKILEQIKAIIKKKLDIYLI